MVKNSFEYATVPPPPNGPLYVVHLYYPNNFPLAKSVGAYLKKNLEIQDHMIMTHEHNALNHEIVRTQAKLVIVEIDEFCDQEATLTTTRIFFQKTIPIIIHATALSKLQVVSMKKHHVVGFFVEHEFSELARLIRAIIT